MIALEIGKTTAQKERAHSNESVYTTIQKAAHVRENDSIRNMPVNKELPSTQQAVFPETTITDSPVVSVELAKISSANKKSIISHLYKKTVGRSSEKIII
ncbi:hypothetical protein INT47_003193 [Mucor saturninus]|uniref:Uncharacterized protein n=1 Tax=Mucor saturninus TaxID=64648 RepID=A0A8H7QYD9_9FUNG|nr:hypothetical protein INT47_003193 [Mucor saturninus]